MQKVIQHSILVALLCLTPVAVFAQTSNSNTINTTNTDNSINTSSTTTNATGNSNVIVSTPGGQIGNQVTSPANTNNVYVVNGNNANGVPSKYTGKYRDAMDRDELQQRQYERAYDAAMQNHDYRDRPSYYNIRGNQNAQFNERNQSYRNGYRLNNGSSNYRSNANSYYRTRRTSR